MGTPRSAKSSGGVAGLGPTQTAGSTATGNAIVTDVPSAPPQAPPIELPTWTKALGWFGVIGLIYLLICAVGIISRGFRGLGGDAAHSLFAFAGNPWVGLCVGVLATVLIQSSTTTTAITVSAVGTGALPIRGAVPIIMGANIGTTVTCTLVALTFVGNRNEFRRALAASTIHDFYNLLALLIFFPIELVWHPIEHISGHLTNAVYGTSWIPDPNRFDLVSDTTRPLVNGVRDVTGHLAGTLGPLFTIVIGALLILVVVRYLGTLLKLLLVGRARDVLTKAIGRRPYVGMAAGAGVTALTQSSTITQSVLVPFAGAGILTPRQIYPVTVGANLGTTFTALFAAFAVEGADARIGLQAAFVHLVYNVFSIVAIFVIPILRPVPLWCAERLAAIAVYRKWLIAVYLIAVFIVAPALVITLVAVI
jgi:solute carrier family 34 (sodium-dependent phosphate cotransporter)